MCPFATCRGTKQYAACCSSFPMLRTTVFVILMFFVVAAYRGDANAHVSHQRGQPACRHMSCSWGTPNGLAYTTPCTRPLRHVWQTHRHIPSVCMQPEKNVDKLGRAYDCRDRPMMLMLVPTAPHLNKLMKFSFSQCQLTAVLRAPLHAPNAPLLTMPR
jgi:hypothetical protein